MTDKYIPPADLERAQRKREAMAEFMRAYVIAAVREWQISDGFADSAAAEARKAWDAIEAEAQR